MPNIETVQIGTRIPESLYLHLQRIARNEAVLRDRNVSMADIVRETLSETFPLPADEADSQDEGNSTE